MAKEIVSAITQYTEAFRAARTIGDGEISNWRPPLMSADRAALRDASVIRARARDLVRNNPFAANAVRMNADSVSGSGLKLALKIDWRSLGISSIEAAAEWQDLVTRAWEAHAEGVDCQLDARRQQTFSQMFSLADRTDYTDGENLAVLELKPGFSPYRTCVNFIDVDRLSNPNGRIEDDSVRGGIERDVYGEPIAYHIREGHPNDMSLGLSHLRWKRVPRATPWGRPIVLHTFDHQRPEMTRGVSAFATAIVPMKMLQLYEDTELERSITQAAYAAYIQTDIDWAKAMEVVGRQATGTGSKNPIVDMEAGLMTAAAEYAEKRDVRFRGAQVVHLLPNEELKLLRSEGPNGNFEAFEANFIRKFATGLGVEAHELGKNYKDVNYSAARAALLAVWRTYRARRIRLVTQFAMPVFGAWLEEAVAIGAVPLPDGVDDFLAAKPYLVRGTFIAWGKPMIDPMKERQAQQLGIQMGTETLESVCAEDGENWRDNADQIAFEKAYCAKLGVPHPSAGMMGAGLDPQSTDEPPVDPDTQEQ